MARRRQFGTIRQLPSGRWQARYTDPATGEHVPAPSTFPTRADAGRWLAAVEADMVRGAWIDQRLGHVRFVDWAQEYLDGAVHLAESTLVQKARVLNRRFVPALGQLPLASITPLTVRRLIEEMAARLAPQTVRTEVAVLASVMQAAVDAGMIATNPAARAKLPKAERAPKPRISLDDLDRLAAAIDPRWRALVLTVGLLGLRWSEAAALRVRSLELLARPPRVHVVETTSGAYTKTDASYRTVPAPQLLAEELAAHLATFRPAPDQLVFPAARGGMLRYNDFRDRQWTPAAREAGLEGLTIHGLRHSAAGNWRLLGIHTQVIARWLGHSDDRITSRVYGWVPDELDTASVASVDAALASREWHVDGTPAAGPSSA